MFERERHKAKKNAAIQYIKLLGLTNPENVREEPDGTFSHVNARGKKRILVPCSTFDEYRKTTQGNEPMQHCIGFYVFEK